MAKVEVLEVNGRKYRVSDIVKMQDVLAALEAGVVPAHLPHIDGVEGMTLEQAEALARERRRESERPAPGTWRPYTEEYAPWPRVLDSVGIDPVAGYTCERCHRPAVGKIDGHPYCQHDLEQFIAHARSLKARIYDYRQLKADDLSQPLGNRWEI